MRRQRSKSGAPAVESEFKEHVVQVDRVTRTVAGGRRMRFRATVVVGNRKGTVGVGLGKADEVSSAVRKAVTQAKKSMLTLPLINDTIPHPIRTSYKSSNLILLPASKGTGIIAGGTVRIIADLVGIKNLLGKSLGSTNKINMAYAVMKAFRMLRTVPVK